MLEQEDLKASGGLMKEIIKGQQQFFNDKQNGQANKGGQPSSPTPRRSPAKTSI